MDSYEDLLEKAEKEMPKKAFIKKRFEIEKVKGHIEGNKTVIVNLQKIAKQLGRKPEHILKYLLKELATPGKYVNNRVIFGSKIPASKINKKIKQYASEFVYCTECGKPDTKIIEKKGVKYLRCMACGSERPVKNL